MHREEVQTEFFPSFPISYVLTSTSGLPDGIISNQKSKFGKILEGLAVEDVVIFYGHLVYFTAI
jgi:hypothetical protein